ncbi:MAG: hypothetical protein LBF22_05080 [Deltaproteobacteria bacterium]|nr:hypothetical protein [Deltaproteobacteria bacterium]
MFTLSKAKAEAKEKGLRPVRLTYSADRAYRPDRAIRSHLRPHRLESRVREKHQHGLEVGEVNPSLPLLTI